MSAPWVVMKFGGTSVATQADWAMIARAAEARLEEGARPFIVCSAVAGISNRLEALIEAAVRGDPHQPHLEHLRATHAALSEALGVPFEAALAARLEALERLILGISLTGEASPRLRARIMAQGELLSTTLGAAYLRASGLDVAWLDAREAMWAEEDLRLPPQRAFLSATCEHAPDAALQARLGDARVVLTQGFIARNADGETVLLGRGGSDTSAAYFAAKLEARRCEIWTDTPGMFTANPKAIPSARLLRRLDYDEAQEIASTGAKILHPRSLPPLRQARIPLEVRCTRSPELEGTRIDARSDGSPQVKAVSVKAGVTLISMDSVGMWQQVGFLADVTACFKRHGLSIDLVSTSEANVTVSLDPSANALDPAVIEALIAELSGVCQARAIGPCAAVSLVGRKIRAFLHRLGPALAVFEEQKIHLVSQAASDLNLTFVVDEAQADRLARELHHLLFDERPSDELLGPPLRALLGGGEGGEEARWLERQWWFRRADALLALATETPTPRYVYDPQTLDAAAAGLMGLRHVDRVFYATKANNFPPILARFERAGLGFECVSPGELRHARAALPGLDPQRLLFTPNFAPREEYEEALALGAWVTLDNLFPLEAWPEVFADQDLIVRLDPGQGHGHHKYVRTAGARSKFGVTLDELDRLEALASAAGARIVGLHAHAGSGIRQSGVWSQTAALLAKQAGRFPHLRLLNLGGGLGVPEKPGQHPLSLEALDASLAAVKAAHPELEVWLEPGRYLVAEAGVLLARVTQLKGKGSMRYVGVDVGMNTLIRPALYGAFHEIINLTRRHAPRRMLADVVGPICESGDTLGYARRLAETRSGDILAVGTAGAYGRVMSSSYNLREPAAEVMLGEG